MPTPPKKIKAPADTGKVLVLFLENVQEIRTWYARTREPGREFGHVVLSTIIWGYHEEALRLAIEGKRWEAGERVP